MKSRMIHMLVALLLLPCCGCVQYASLIELNPDGTGRLLLRILFSNRGDNPLASFALSKSTSSEDAPADQPTKWTERNLKEIQGKLEGLAEQLGEGVTYVSQKPTKEKGWTGVQATYTFQDINKLHLSGGPPADQSNDASPQTVDTSKAPKFDFKFIPGKVSELKVTLASNDPKSPTEESDPFEEAGLPVANASSAANSLATSLLKAALQDARFSALVKINGEILETNARFKPKPNSFFLMDLDLGQFVKSEAFDRSVAENWDFAKMVGEETPGLRAHKPGETITVRFRPAK